MEKGFDSSSVRDLSLQEVLSAIFEEISQLLKLVKKNWVLFVIGMIVSATIGWYSNKSPYYQTNYSFFMHSESLWMDSAVRNPKAFFVGDIHIPAANPLEKMSQIINSEKIIYNALLSKETIDGRNDLLVNHYIRLNLVNAPSFSTTNQMIPLSDSNYESISKTSQEVLNFIYPLLSDSVERIVDRESSIINVIVKNKNKDFAFAFVNAIFKSFVDFCKQESVSSTAKNLKIIKVQIDSLEKMKPVPVIISDLYRYRELLKFQMLVNPPTVTVVKKPAYPVSYITESKWKRPVYYTVIYFISLIFLLRMISLLKGIPKANN